MIRLNYEEMDQGGPGLTSHISPSITGLTRLAISGTPVINMKNLDSMTLESPLGKLTIVSDGRAVVAVRPPNAEGTLPVTEGGAGNPVLNQAADELRRYFDGTLTNFTVPVSFDGGTEFQRAVWTALAAIPYGETRSYSWVAREIGRPAALRAVGRACGQNPVAIIVPCHRVIGVDGGMTGYAGGLDCKRALLGLEQRNSAISTRRAAGRQ